MDTQIDGSQTPLVSVIVPAYNVEQYIDPCVDALIHQTYRNIEIILVDDGSTDATGQKCDYWASCDSRIHVIHQHNQGLSMARNNGLTEAHGTYIVYLDGDDNCTLDCVERLYSAITSHEADLCLCSYDRIDESGEVISVRHIPFISHGTEKDLLMNILHDDLPPCAWAKMYTEELARQAYFDCGQLFEDTRMWARLLPEIESLAFCSIDEALFHYRQNTLSIMGSFHAERERGIIDAWEKMCSNAEGRYGDEIRPYVGFRRAWMYFEVLDRAIANGAAHEQDYCDEAVSYLRSHADDVYASDVFSAGRKAAMRVLSFSKPLYFLLRRSTIK